MLGKHTDYAGGRSLLCAVERGFRVTMTRRRDAVVTVTDAATGESDRFALDADLRPARPRHWSLYPRAVARRIARNFPLARRGADMTFQSDLPSAAGLSSSSAFMISVFFALAASNDLQEHSEYGDAIQTREDLAAYLASVENGSGFRTLAGDRGVGTAGGSEDHTAILCCQRGFLSLYSFSPTELERTVAMPAGYLFAVAASGVVAEKTGAAMAHYNRAAAQTAELLRRSNAASGRADRTLATALAATPHALEELRAALMSSEDAPLAARLEQFLEESTAIVPRGADSLMAGNLEAFGALVDRSQQLAGTSLQNQVPETVMLARTARSLGAPAASAFGAGFGGSVWALVDVHHAHEFLDAWAVHYRREFPGRAADASFFLTGAGAAATEV